MPVTGSPNEPGAAELLPEEPEEPEEGEEVEADARRPGVITVAFWLLITSAVLWVLVSGSGDPAEQQGTAAILCVYIWSAVRVRRGRWTARIVGTAAAVWLLVVPGSLAWGFMDPENPYGREYAVLAVVAVVLTGTGVALLYGRRGTTYFRRRPR
jgi:drug/metabolite transporter (DMT)-like permease